jgi:hypothetical protein
LRWHALAEVSGEDENIAIWDGGKREAVDVTEADKSYGRGRGCCGHGSLVLLLVEK